VDVLGEAEASLGADRFNEEAGHGVSATVEGSAVLVGTRRWMARHGMVLTASAEEETAAMEVLGRTAVLVAIDGAVAGVIALADEIKPDARDTVKRLQAMGVAVRMLTGDNRRAAATVARELGIPTDLVQAEALPSGKIATVEALLDEGRQVAMVGDGINDAPALAKATVGVAIGAGTQVAMDAADVVLVRSELADIVTAVDLSRVTFRRIWINYFFAFIYNTLGIPVAAGALYPALRVALPPELAALAMALSSVCVVLSSLALRRYKPPRMGGARRPSGGASPEEGSTSDLEAEAASELTSLLLEPGCSCDCGTACAANNRLHAVRDRSGGARVAEAAIEALFEVRGQTGTCKCGCVCTTVEGKLAPAKIQVAPAHPTGESA